MTFPEVQSSLRRSRAALLLGLLLAPAIEACERRGDLREWSVGDHDHMVESEPQDDVAAVDRRGSPMVGNPAEPLPGASTTADVAAGPPPSASPHTVGGEGVFEVWAKNCVPCHGRIGQGDGTMRGMGRLPNFTEPAWQDATDDASLAATIREGKGPMPAFPLPTPTLSGLVSLIRRMGGAETVSAGSPVPDVPPGHQ